MVNLVTISDFSNPYLVFAPVGTEQETYLNELIAKYQKDILIQILGVQTYNDMETNITDAIWVDFINGKTYTLDNVEYQYKGIKEVLTNFIYYYWNLDKSNGLIPEGAVVTNFDENTKVIPISKMVNAWNDACNLIYNNIVYSADVYHYLSEFAPETWIFSSFKKQNVLGI